MLVVVTAAVVLFVSVDVVEVVVIFVLASSADAERACSERLITCSAGCYTARIVGRRSLVKRDDIAR